MTATIDAFESTDELRATQRKQESRDIVRVVNLGFDEGTRIFFAQEIFKMPKRGESFRVPRLHAERLIRSQEPGKLAFPRQVAAVKSAMGDGDKATVPPGFAVISEQDALDYAEFKAAKERETQQTEDEQETLDAETEAETQKILDELD